jgi:hypothetical protein
LDVVGKINQNEWSRRHFEGTGNKDQLPGIPGSCSACPRPDGLDRDPLMGATRILRFWTLVMAVQAFPD